MFDRRIEVLVVGAGPVGMFLALLLSRAGIRVRIIDQEARTAARTYACALHPELLELLAQLGLGEEILQAALRVETLAFYQGAVRRAEASFGRLQVQHPYVAVLPQSTLEEILEARLRTEAGLHIDWNHQLSGLRSEGNAAVATVDTMKISAKGYIVPEMDWSVQRREEWRVEYVIGADGPNSFVAKNLGLPYAHVGAPEFYAVFEFQSDWKGSDELRVVIDSGRKSVLWPVSERRYRWSFQLGQEHLSGFPAKERQSAIVSQPELDRVTCEFMQRLISARAPWFEGSIEELGWSSDVEFERRVISRFGVGRWWLAGDAAHQTSPAGMQSMNAGLLEAQRLAAALTQVLRANESVESLEQYNQWARNEWHALLGISGQVKARPDADPWVKEHRAELLSCVPALGGHLKAVLEQLGLELPFGNASP